jgi:hypothetical protein
MLNMLRYVFFVGISLLCFTGCFPSAEKVVYTVKNDRIKIEYTDFNTATSESLVHDPYPGLRTSPNNGVGQLLAAFEELTQEKKFTAFAAPFIGNAEIVDATGGIWIEQMQVHAIVVGTTTYSSFVFDLHGSPTRLIFLPEFDGMPQYHVVSGRKLDQSLSEQYQGDIQQHLLSLFVTTFQRGMAMQEGQDACLDMFPEHPSRCGDDMSPFMLFDEMAKEDCSTAMLGIALYTSFLVFPLTPYDCTMPLYDHVVESIKAERYTMYAIAPDEEFILEMTAPMTHESQSVLVEHAEELQKIAISPQQRQAIAATFDE